MTGATSTSPSTRRRGTPWWSTSTPTCSRRARPAGAPRSPSSTARRRWSASTTAPGWCREPRRQQGRGAAMEIVIRAVVMFAFLWGVTRAVGRSTLGDLVQQSITQQDYSVTSGVLAVGVFALLTVALSWAQWRFPAVRPAINGEPLMIVRDGVPLEAAMRRQRLSVDDLMVAARLEGVRRLQDVEVAVLEADGRISFFTFDSSTREGAPETQMPG